MQTSEQVQQQQRQSYHLEQVQSKLKQIQIQQQKPLFTSLQQQQQQQQQTPSSSSQLPYFIYSFQPSSSILIGKCEQMCPSLSSSFQDKIDQLQKYPLKRIKKYYRNQQYSQKSIHQLRSPQTLDRTVDYLIENHFILLIESQKRLKKVLITIQKWKLNKSNKSNINNKYSKQLTSTSASTFLVQKISQIKQIHLRYGNNFRKLRRQVIIFLQDRLKSIRCQLFASSIIFPQLTLKLIKCQILLFTLAQQNISLTGLQQLLDPSILHIMSQSYPKQFHQCLLISILSCRSQQLTLLLHNNCQFIFQSQQLSSLLSFRLSTFQSLTNYHKYFSTLRDTQSSLIILLLWCWIDKIRQDLQKILIASKLNVKKGWLNLLMGFKKSNISNHQKYQSDQIINLYQNKTYLEENNKNYGMNKKEQLLQWIKEDKLFQILLQ